MEVFTWGVAPQAVQVIEGAYFRGEEVDDDVAEVHEHPRRDVRTFDADGAYVFLFEGLPEVFGERGEVALRLTRSEDDDVGIAGLVIDVEYNNVGGFFLEELLGDVVGEGEGLGVSGRGVGCRGRAFSGGCFFRGGGRTFWGVIGFRGPFGRGFDFGFAWGRGFGLRGHSPFRGGGLGLGYFGGGGAFFTGRGFSRRLHVSVFSKCMYNDSYHKAAQSSLACWRKKASKAQESFYAKGHYLYMVGAHKKRRILLTRFITFCFACANHESSADISSPIGGFDGFYLDNAGAAACFARFVRGHSGAHPAFGPAPEEAVVFWFWAKTPHAVQVGVLAGADAHFHFCSFYGVGLAHSFAFCGGAFSFGL